MEYMWYMQTSDELYHHGIKGQKWGVRRFQNRDGRLTSAGRSRNKNKDSPTGKKKMPTKKKVAIGVGIAGAGIAAALVGRKIANYVDDRNDARADLAMREALRRATDESNVRYINSALSRVMRSDAPASHYAESADFIRRSYGEEAFNRIMDRVGFAHI